MLAWFLKPMLLTIRCCYFCLGTGRGFLERQGHLVCPAQRWTHYLGFWSQGSRPLCLSLSAPLKKEFCRNHNNYAESAQSPPYQSFPKLLCCAWALGIETQPFASFFSPLHFLLQNNNNKKHYKGDAVFFLLLWKWRFWCIKHRAQNYLTNFFTLCISFSVSCRGNPIQPLEVLRSCL